MEKPVKQVRDPTGGTKIIKPSVLIVDDHVENLRILTNILEPAGFATRPTTRGSEALAAAAITAPDLVLVDVRMPDMDGFEVCTRLKRIKGCDNTPVIFISALGAVEDRVRAFRVGGSDFITRPFESDEVIARIHVHWELCLARRRLEASNEELEARVAERTKELETTNERLKKNERLLFKAKTDAEKANKAKSQFLAVMSHEIRTPLNAIVGIIDLLSEREIGLNYREDFRILRGSSENLLLLIGDILDLSGIEAGKIDLVEEPADVVELIEDIITIVKRQAMEQETKIECSVESSFPSNVVCDKRRFKQVVLNLLNNAVKFTRGGVVTIEARFQNGYGQFKVADNGIGISKKDLGNVFDIFFQAHSPINVGGTKGSGLGLAICKSLVEKMGGNIDVKSSPGVGTEFTFALPMVIPEKSSCREALYRSSKESYYSPKAVQLSILVAEDSPENQYLIKKYLEESRFLPVIVNDGEEAIQRFQKQEFDIVLMDIQMPKMDGFSATRMLRKYEESIGQRRTPILALSAGALSEDLHRSHEAGFDRYLLKPIKKQQLLDALNKAAACL